MGAFHSDDACVLQLTSEADGGNLVLVKVELTEGEVTLAWLHDPTVKTSNQY